MSEDNSGIGRLSTILSEVASQMARRQFDDLINMQMSPIEALFEVAMVGLLQLAPNLGQVRRLGSLLPDIEPQLNVLQFVRQARVLDWPVDFLIITRGTDGQTHRAVVECDGHEFHERTKEQAERDRSRDRRLQAEGIRVFRFTGSELHREATAPVVEILKWARPLWGLPS